MAVLDGGEPGGRLTVEVTAVVDGQWLAAAEVARGAEIGVEALAVACVGPVAGVAGTADRAFARALSGWRTALHRRIFLGMMSRNTPCFAMVALVCVACVHSPEEEPALLDRAAYVPPEARGAYRVHERELPDGLGVLYLPSSLASAPDPSLYPLPLVLFAPGFSAGPRDYADTSRHLASHGFAVVGADHGFNFVSAALCATQKDGKQRIERALSVARALAREDGGDLKGAFEPVGFGAVGHSYGGKLALWLASERADVEAVVAFDPVDGGGERRPGFCPPAPGGFPSVRERLSWAELPPSLMVGAGRAGECAPAEGNAEALFAALGEGVLLRLPEAGHQDFVDAAASEDCPGCGFCPASGEDAVDVQRLSRGVLVAFLQATWRGDARYAEALREAGEGALLTPPPTFEWVER